MKFDDFNYQVYNPYILVQEEKKKKGDKKGEDDKSRTDGIDSTVTGMEGGLGGMGKGPALSAYNLEQKNYAKYEFQSISVHTPDNKEEH